MSSKMTKWIVAFAITLSSVPVRTAQAQDGAAAGQAGEAADGDAGASSAGAAAEAGAGGHAGLGGSGGASGGQTVLGGRANYDLVDDTSGKACSFGHGSGNSSLVTISTALGAMLLIRRRRGQKR